MASEQQALTQDVRLFGYRTNTGQPLDWWLDTGIQVAAGSSVSVSCFGTGRNLPWGGGPQFDCRGDQTQPPWSLSIAPACRFGSLVGKIGRNGTPSAWARRPRSRPAAAARCTSVSTTA